MLAPFGPPTIKSLATALPVHSLGRNNSLYVRVRPSSRHSLHDWCHQSRGGTQESKELFLLKPGLFRAFCT